MTAHAVIACILCISAIFRHSIPYNVRVIIIIGFFYVIGIGGLLQFGLIAGAIPLLIITPSLATIFFSARTGVGVFILVAISVSVIGYGFVTGFLGLDLDLNTYAKLPIAWITFILASSIAMISALVAIAQMNNALLESIEVANKKDEAEQANQAKSEFLSSMSHELRTPLNAVLGFGQLLEDDPNAPLEEKQKGYVQQILKGGDQLLILIDQVLELSKIEAGRVDLLLENVSPQESIDECLTMVGAQAKDRNIEILYLPPDFDLPELIVDHNRFNQVLLNLLTNAIKYNHLGGKVTVTASLSSNDFLRFSVTDTGYGIAKDKQKELFEPFNRLGRESGDIEGTGIGLTITKQIVELMGGRIGFESEQNVGSTFWIEMQISKNRPKETTKPSLEKMQDQTAESNDATGTILYIEDNSANIRLMEAIIGRLPETSLKTAHTAELGLELARDINPDLILMDINLPGMDGIEALNNLRSNEQTKDIPVIAISAAVMPIEIERSKAAGFEDYLSKPIKVPETLKAINEHIG